MGLIPRKLCITTIKGKLALSLLGAGFAFVMLIINLQNGNPVPMNLSFCEGRTLSNQSLHGQVVLRGLTRGRWQPKDISVQDRKLLDSYTNMSLRHFSLPPSLSRDDGKCGDVPLYKYPQDKPGWFGRLFYSYPQEGLGFRALCDPKGHKACCFQGQCTAKSTTECTCENCIDARTQIMSETSEWVPQNKNVKFLQFSNKEACNIIRRKYDHVIFLGDSLVRHMYSSVLAQLRDDPQNGCLKDNTPSDVRARCSQKYYQFSDKLCNSQYLQRDGRVCGGKVRLQLLETTKARYSKREIHKLRTLKNTEKKLVVFSVGMHDDFDIDVTIKGFVEPILGILKGQRSPHLGILWVNPHLPGLLKPINARLQQKSHTLAYSSHMTKFFEGLCIPVFETKHFTDNVFSVDGTHYGYGVNSLKARILINYLNQISQGGES